MPTGAQRIDDKDVKIPAAIKASAEKANEIYKQVYQTSVEPADPAAEPPKEPPALPAPTEAPALPPPAPTPADPVTQKGNEPPVEPQGGWEHAYKSMKGRHDSLKDINKQLVESNRMLMDHNAQLQAAAATPHAPAPAPTPAPAETTAASLLTPKEVEDYGADFLGVVGKKAKEALTPEVAALQQQVAELKNQLQGVGTSVRLNAREQMKADLAQAVPDWEQINHDQNFHAWLALRDPLSGNIKHAMLKEAWDRNDAVRVQAFFKGFLAQEATSAPADPQPDPSQGKVPLESLAAPGRAKPAADVSQRSPAEKPIITRSEIANFYRDVAAGRWRGRDPDKLAYEAQIASALREGRVR